MVRDVAQRLRVQMGCYWSWEWERFLTDCGMTVYVTTLPRAVNAVIDGRVVLIAERLSATERAWSAFHEAGHLWLHAGDHRFWRSRPQGYLTVGKFERQADDFAALFPIWMTDDLP